MPLTSTVPKAEASALSSLVPAVAGDVPAAAAQPRQQTEGEAHQADRALHAMLARLTAGISPVALLLAYTDWLSHLAASPQRQAEISQEAIQDTKRLFESAQQYFKPDQRPWSLIKP
jgi:polyhydroxyalkanoate synthase